MQPTGKVCVRVLYSTGSLTHSPVHWKDWRIVQKCIVKRAVDFKFPASFVAYVGRYAMTEAKDGRKKKHHMVKAVECRPGEVGPIPASARLD